MNNEEESVETQLKLAMSHTILPQSSVDDAIDAVLAMTAKEVITEQEDIHVELIPEESGSCIPAVSEEGLARQEKEKLYCVCREPSSGDMIGCKNLQCKVEWFHFPSVKIK